MRRVFVATCLLLILASCGGDEITLTEYAETVERHTTTMYARLEAFTDEAVFAGATVEKIQTIFGEITAAYRRLSDGLQAIEPPAEISAVHDAAVEIAANLAAAGDALARRADAVETPDELSALFASPESQAIEAAAIEMVTFCQERQAEFDATADREVFAGTPWIPAEMQEVVLVAFGCDNEIIDDS